MYSQRRGLGFGSNITTFQRRRFEWLASAMCPASSHRSALTSAPQLTSNSANLEVAGGEDIRSPALSWESRRLRRLAATLEVTSQSTLVGKRAVLKCPS